MAEGQQKADAVVGKGVKPKRAGETPRQQIRKAKATRRRQFSAEEKIPPEAGKPDRDGGDPGGRDGVGDLPAGGDP